jgi:hypothetical protein
LFSVQQAAEQVVDNHAAKNIIHAEAAVYVIPDVEDLGPEVYANSLMCHTSRSAVTAWTLKPHDASTCNASWAYQTNQKSWICPHASFLIFPHWSTLGFWAFFKSFKAVIDSDSSTDC